MRNLPKFFIGFFTWWALETPKRLFTIGKRLVTLINSQISFTLNVRLIFTPLFGDYTVVGRMIGFVVRSIEIVFGVVIMGIFATVVLALPVAWLLLPVFLFNYINILVAALYYGVYAAFVFSIRNVPVKRLINITNPSNIDEILLTFRPSARLLYFSLLNNFNQNIQAAIKKPDIQLLLKKAELSLQEFSTKLVETPNFDTRKIPFSALEYAKKHRSRYVETEQVFLAALANIPKVELLMSSFGTTLDLLEGAARWLVEERELLAKISIFQDDYVMLFTGGIGKGMTGHVTPYLDSMSTDFTKEAKYGGYLRFTVREGYIRKIGEMLAGSNQNILIIGDPGCGKTSLVRGIAYKILEGSEYKSLTNKRIVSVEMSGLISGATNPGLLAEKIDRAFKEAKSSGDIVLFIDEIHNLVAGAGDKNAESAVAYSILEPNLSGGKIQFIGATSKQNYRKYIEPNGAFSRLFNVLELEPASKEETIQIMKFDVAELEAKKGIFVTYPALEKIVTLSQKLIHERVLPDKAIGILDRAASAVESTTKLVNTTAIEKEISDTTHVPVETVTQDEAKKLLNIETELKEMVVGQDFAIKQVGAALKRARAGIRNEGKPIASFLFVGTTGVGKTQTAKALAKCYFGNAKNMIRLDMSEYQQIDSIDRLIGSPDGSTKGVLTENIRSRPFALLLLDEIEKAHPNILLTFLQVLDDGRLTDSTGLVIDFTNTIIIATSNAGTRAIQEASEAKKTTDEMKEVAMVEVRAKFAPEFLNRFNGIIVFNPLSMENAHEIAKLLLSNVRKSAEERGIKLSFSDELINEVTKKGFSPEWGARPMARVIEDNVESYLAEKMLAGEFKQGDEKLIGVEVFDNR